MIGGLVEDEAAGTAGGLDGKLGTRPLPRRKAPCRPQHVRRVEVELASSAHTSPSGNPEAAQNEESKNSAPGKRALACPTSPKTTEGPTQRGPAESGSRPNKASSRVVFPLPFAPATETRSPQLTNRSIGPRRKEPRSSTASSSATTSSPERPSGARSSWSSHGCHGFSPRSFSSHSSR